MESGLDQPMLLARSHALPRGPRVRLRLAQTRDARAIRELVKGRDHELELQELEIARLVHLDPRRRVVVCACALIDSRDAIVGLGAMDVGASEPDLLVVDDELTDGLDELLARALRTRAQTLAGADAA
jgi:hypothetical protein